MTRGRCLSYGQGITFWPIAEALREVAGVHDDDPLDLARSKLDALASGDTAASERAAAAVGLTDAAYPIDELFFGLRRVLTSIAEGGPLVVTFEDLHWAEPTMLELVDHLAAAPAPLLLLCTARDELADDGDGWAAQSGGTTIELDRLSADEAAELAAGLAGSAVPPATLRTIVETAGGNPLFLEQMLAMIQDAPGGDIAVPPTIHALLSARLDRLDGGQRDVVGTAAVVGLVFPKRGAQPDAASAGRRRRRRGSGCAGTRTPGRWSSRRRAAGAAAAARARPGRRARRPAGVRHELDDGRLGEDLADDRRRADDLALRAAEPVEPGREERADRRRNGDVAAGRVLEHREHLLQEERVAARGLDDRPQRSAAPRSRPRPPARRPRRARAGRAR